MGRIGRPIICMRPSGSRGRGRRTRPEPWAAFAASRATDLVVQSVLVAQQTLRLVSLRLKFSAAAGSGCLRRGGCSDW